MNDQDDAICIQLLGTLLIKAAAALPTEFKSKARALFIFLLMERKAIARTRLDMMFWPDAATRGSLNRELSYIRKVIGNRLVCIDDTVEIRPDGFELDIEEFTRLAQQDNRAALLHAMRLYSDEFMAGFSLNGCPEFDHWLERQREIWYERGIKLLQRASNWHLSTDEVQEFAQKLLSATPWREDLNRLIMLHMARNKVWSAAIKQFRAFKQILSQEIGEEPDSASYQLLEHIKRAKNAFPFVLPAEQSVLVGRVELIEKVVNEICTPSHQQITLVGPGGIGKTRIAIAVAKLLADSFLDGVCFLSFSSLASANMVPTILAEAFHIPISGSMPLRQRLIDHFVDKELLLVIDNFEHLVEQSSLLVDILEYAPSVKILVTSQIHLSTPTERVIDIPGLSFAPEKHNTNSIDDFPSTRLFRQAARAVQPDFFASTDDLNKIALICSSLFGVPLAIVIAGASVRHHTCAEIAEGIGNSLRFLNEKRLGGQSRQRSVEAAFEYSWNLLPYEQQKLLSKLAFFSGSFSIDMAEQVAECSSDDLTGLCNKSFVNQMSTTRFALHGLIREFARAKMDKDDQLVSVTTGLHSKFFINLLIQNPVISHKVQPTALSEIALSIADIRRAWRWAIDHDTTSDRLLAAAKSLFDFYHIRGWYEEGYQAVSDAIAKLIPAETDLISNTEQTSLIGYLFVQHALFSANCSRLEEANSYAQRAHTIISEQSDLEALVLVLKQLGYCAHNLSQFDAAQKFYEQALALGDRLGESHHYVNGTRINLGLLQRSLGNFEQAQTNFIQCLEIATRVDDRRIMAYAHGSCGVSHCDFGNYSDAIRHTQLSLDLFSEIGEIYGISLNHVYFASIYRAIGELAQANHHAHEALSRLRKIKDGYGASYAQIEIAENLVASEKYSEALGVYEECVVKRVVAEIPTQLALIYLNMGRIHTFQGHYTEAARWLEISHDIYEVHGCVPFVARCLSSLAELVCFQGEKTKWRSQFVQALQLAENTNAKPLLLDILSDLSYCLTTTEESGLAFAISEHISSNGIAGYSARQRALQTLHRIKSKPEWRHLGSSDSSMETLETILNLSRKFLVESKS